MTEEYNYYVVVIVLKSTLTKPLTYELGGIGEILTEADFKPHYEDICRSEKINKNDVIGVVLHKVDKDKAKKLVN